VFADDNSLCYLRSKQIQTKNDFATSCFKFLFDYTFAQVMAEVSSDDEPDYMSEEFLASWYGILFPISIKQLLLCE